MSATISYATMLAKKKDGRENAIQLADLFCRDARVRIEENFKTMFSNHDDFAYKTAVDYLEGGYDWLMGSLVHREDVATPEAVEAAMAALAK